MFKIANKVILCFLLIFTFSMCDGKKDSFFQGGLIINGKESESKSNSSSPTKNGNKGLICIDPGHQKKGNSGMEEVAPGSSTKKPKVSSGTAGVATKKNEYELNLEVGLKLKKKLEEKNYSVFMIRETHDVNISNKERAIMTNDAGCTLYIRLHADGSENKNTKGISVLTSSAKNPYTKKVQASSEEFSKIVLNELIKSTGAVNKGVSYRDDLTGTNWSEVTNTLVEMGFMSNPEEDKKLSTSDYQNKIVNGIVNGIDKYLGN